jgi:predicted nucleotidyltransferase
VKGIYLDRDALLDHIKKLADKALLAFPEIVEIRLLGSLAVGQQTGLSDVDLFVLLKYGGGHPIERMKPYYFFFSRGLEMALDMIVATEEEKVQFVELLEDSYLIAAR